MKYLILMLPLLTGCTFRTVRYQGVEYSHRSFAASQTFGELHVRVTNGVADVKIINFANDQVSAIRETRGLIQDVRGLLQ